jgi:hypothetical protein
VSGLRQEFQLNTPGQVGGYLRDALLIVEDCNVPDDLRVAAFTAAIGLVSAKQIMMEQVAPSSPLMAMPRGR